MFLGNSLRLELNRTQTVGALTIRHEVSPLTSVIVDIARQQDRFEFSPERDADSTALAFGLRFDPVALVSGTALLGYREFTPTSADVESYTGTTASVDLSYVALGSTKVTLRAARDLHYSFEFAQPYYLQTGLSTVVAQQIYGPVDVEARLGRHQLAYRDRQGAFVAVSDRVDRVRSYGYGVGYRVGRDLRLGFNVEHQRRQSQLSNRSYEGRRFGLALAYGL
jgi:hypothetical protein